MCEAKGCKRNVYHYGYRLCYLHYEAIRNGINVQRK